MGHRFILDNSLLLLAGTRDGRRLGERRPARLRLVARSLHFRVNDIGMVFFFALAAKEVFQATLPGGPLVSPRRAVSPLAAAVGGMAAPAPIYVTLGCLAAPANSLAGGRSRVPPTSPSRQWSRGSFFPPAIPPFRSCSCWRSPTTPSGYSFWRFYPSGYLSVRRWAF